MNHHITNLEKSPEFQPAAEAMRKATWPAFLLHSDDHRWDLLLEWFTRYQLLLISGNDLMGVVHAAPMFWNETIHGLPGSIGEVMISAVGCRGINRPCNALAVLASVTPARHRENGVGKAMLSAAMASAAEHDLRSVIVPVRPAFKTRHPLTPFDEYVSWRRTDGSPFDPWLRAHWKMGGSMMKTAPKAVSVNGSVADWENWTDRPFDESGEYVVDGALQPVLIDRGRDYGRYEDPNVWVRHDAGVWNRHKEIDA